MNDAQAMHARVSVQVRVPSAQEPYSTLNVFSRLLRVARFQILLQFCDCRPQSRKNSKKPKAKAADAFAKPWP